MADIHFTTEEIENDPILVGMLRDKLPLTRENYIIRNWVDQVPKPWTAEAEEELPVKLQNWDQFEKKA